MHGVLVTAVFLLTSADGRVAAGFTSTNFFTMTDDDLTTGVASGAPAVAATAHSLSEPNEESPSS
jgi:hypothetical protein